jgi:flagellin
VDNAGVYRLASKAFTTVGGGETEVFTVQNASGSATVTLDATTGASAAAAIAAINAQAAPLGIYAVAGTAANTVTIQSSSGFSLAVGQDGSATTGLFGGAGAQTIAAPNTTATVTGNALAALAQLSNAVNNIGLVQGRVGTGQNKFSYAVNLANSQLASFSAAESRIRDADMAAEAANLTKAQVMQQASLAAMAQANAAPQAILALLRG